MKRRPSALAPVAILAALVGLAAAPGIAPAAGRHAKKPRPTVFEVCHRGCRYRAIQRAVDAAGSYAFHHKRAKVTVAVHPGRYVEAVVLDGAARRKRFDGMTIAGTKRNAKRVILEGRRARGRRGGAANGIEATGVDRLVLKNIWARNYGLNGFVVQAAEPGSRGCHGYMMNNLRASGNRFHGLVAKHCRGGKMINSVAYHQGGSAFYVGETPCDRRAWSVYDGTPCQRQPRWTLLKDDRGYENALGYSGMNSKYVRVIENALYDNGAGVILDTLEAERYRPNGWNRVERNDVFWNNYNHFLARSPFKAVPAGLGEIAGQGLDYPTGVGILVAGGDADVVRGNRVFGNYKWGIASFSWPGEAIVANGDEAKNVDNEIVENAMGRGGADPNGEYDFWNDATGGGNCWGANSAGATFAPGNGKLGLGQIYPICPRTEVDYAAAGSVNLEPGLQIPGPGEAGDPETILGYLGTSPPRDQQCSWVRRVAAHPTFQGFEPAEVTPRPGEVTC